MMHSDLDVLKDSITSEDDLVWYYTDMEYWWPSVLEIVALDSIDEKICSEQDLTELFIAEIDMSPLYRVTLLGRTSSMEGNQLLCPASKDARVRSFEISSKSFRTYY